ncbi:hypothetical protein EJ08DRAFT_53851 [Tothia fuscella]|uniref:Endonuclease/exonuclease/phosphatase domain-containing protein n=1 Tax=Tothia fuscella TaxID=1048955 RepID=A0A9P4NFH1_9PEZI|nr:hypothetical protein EJ08DRAFT_53851 [Tothia fuscella]
MLERLIEKVERLRGLEWDVKSLAVLSREDSGEMKVVDQILLSRELGEEDVEGKTAPQKGFEDWTLSYMILNEAEQNPLVAGQTSDTKRPLDISIASYNLMVEPRAPSLDIRAPRLLENILSFSLPSSSALDVLCLQEVNEEMLAWLLKDLTLRRKYPYCTHIVSSIFPSKRNLVTFASRQFTFFTLQFEERHKSSLLAYFVDLDITVANVHLSSALTDSAVRTKRQHMLSLDNFLTKNPQLLNSQVIVVGDFNLTTSSRTIETASTRRIITSDTAALVGEVIDRTLWDDTYLMWDDLGSLDEDEYDGEEGATFDRLRNALAATFGAPIDNRPQRYDRILVRAGSTISVERHERFGLPDANGECASDHYGVLARLLLQPIDIKRTELGEGIQNLGRFPKESIPLITDATNVEQIIAPYLPTASDRSQREHALEDLRQTLMKNDRLSDMVLAPLGSYSIDTYFPDSDIDLLAIGSIPPREFFDLAIAKLRSLERHGRTDSDDGFRAVHYVNSLVPIVETVVQGIKVDLQYCQAIELVKAYHSADNKLSLEELVLDTEIISMLPPASLRPLNTYRDTAYLLTTIPNLTAYRIAHRFLSLYLKRRGLYSAKFGYLGGIHVSLMLNRVVKLLGTSEDVIGKCSGRSDGSFASGNISSSSIVRSFFEYYAKFNWSKDIVDDPHMAASGSKPTRSAREAVFIQSIFTPTARLNVASSCTVFSAHTFTSEFALAKKKLDEGNWDWCLRPREDCAREFLKDFGAFVCITLDLWDINDIGGGKVREMTGSLESKITGLMVNLGRIEGLKGRVWPARFRQQISVDEEESPALGGEQELRGYYLVGISAREGMVVDEKKIFAGKVLNAARTFERLAKDLKGFGEGHVWVEVEVLPRKKIGGMGFVLDDRDWGRHVRFNRAVGK